LHAQRDIGNRRDPDRGRIDSGSQSQGIFLLLSSTGLAYRRCELVRVNGAEIDVQFLQGKLSKKKGAKSPQEALSG
jgi:hypothetical protein